MTESIASALSRAIKAGVDAGSKEVGDLFRKLATGEVDFVSDLAPASGISSADLLYLVQADGTTKSLSLSQLVGYMAPLLGTGTGGDPEVPPDLPPTAAFNVPDNRPTGAIIGHVAPTIPAVPTPTWTMTPYTGLDVLADSGDVYITSAASFFAAIGSDTATVTLTATNTAGSSTSTVTFTATSDYVDLPSNIAANLTMNFDIIDNREITYDAISGLVTLVGDKSPENRDARNSQDRMSYVLTSNIGAGKPAIRGNGATGPTSGMFFNQNPIWQGIRLAYLSTTSLVDRLTLTIDKMYKNGSTNSPNESALQDVFLDFNKGALTAQPCLVTVIIEGANLTYRLNGVEIGTLVLNSYNQPQYPVIGFFLFYATAITGTNALIGVSALGQARSWKGGAMNGDICQIVQYLNAVAG
jgi:hypothetical protein